MSLLDFLSPALTVGTEAAGAQQQAQLQSSLMKRQQEIQALLMQRQFHNQDIENTLKEAQTANAQKQYDPTVRHDIAAAEGGGKVEGETPGLLKREQQMGPIKAGNAALTASAENPALISRAQGVAQATLPTDLTKIDRRVQAETAGARMQQSVARLFQQQNAQLVNSVQPYAQAKTAFQEARQGNPAALKSALIAYASVADPKAQLRQGVMNYVTRVDPSFKGTFEMALDRLTSGKLPPQVIDNMEKMVDRVHQTNASIYEQRRHAFLQRQPLAESFTPTTEELFNVPGVTSGAGTGSDFGPFGQFVPKQ